MYQVRVVILNDPEAVPKPTGNYVYASARGNVKAGKRPPQIVEGDAGDPALDTERRSFLAAACIRASSSFGMEIVRVGFFLGLRGFVLMAQTM